MSLALLQSYSSDEEEVLSTTSDEVEDAVNGYGEERQEEEVVSPPRPPSVLPSAAQVFAEVTGPPDFLLHSVVVDTVATKSGALRAAPPAAVVEAKPQLVSLPPDTADNSKPSDAEGGIRSLRPQNPPLEDAASLLRMCVSCGVPKIFSGDRMVCPQCKDRPPQQAEGGNDKRHLSQASSKVKDKERSKRMKGQSSHATWKSETEMVLRQQFD